MWCVLRVECASVVAASCAANKCIFKYYYEKTALGAYGLVFVSKSQSSSVVFSKVDRFCAGVKEKASLSM